MAEPLRLLIPGGAGVFGRLLAHELLQRTNARLVLAGRDLRRLNAAAAGLHSPRRVRALRLDLHNPDALAAAARGCVAVACTAGLFQTLPRELPARALAAGAHWLDLADAAGWVIPLLADRSLDATAAGAGLSVVPGLSTVPALSGALARWCHARLPGARRARITLFIGQRNAKGAAAITSALSGGLAGPLPVDLPLGRRPTYRGASPDAALLRRELGLAAEFRVGFELGAANRLMVVASRLAARLGPEGRGRLGGLLALLAAPTGSLGSPLSCLQAELLDEHGERVRAAFISAGQRLAVLPCALALEELLTGSWTRRGVVDPAAWLTPDEWVARLRARGIRFVAG